MSTGPSNLFGLAVALRTAIDLGFANDAVSLPERQEIIGVNPVGECEKLTIELDRVFIGIAGQAETPQPVNRGITRAATLNVYIFRCVWTPDGEGLTALQSPSVDIMDAEAKLILTDAYELHRVISAAHLNGTFEGFCSGLSLGPVTKIPTEGGIGGIFVQLTAELS